MRTKYSLMNVITNLICNIGIILIGLVAQAVFIRILGTEYLGINGLFTNILSILGIVELGMGNAIVFHLYKPIADDRKEEVKSLMLFYKKAYNMIALIVLVIGLCIVPFLRFFVGEVNIEINLKAVYILFLVQTVTTYLFSYKTSIFIASQRNYVIKISHLIYQLVMNLLQLVLLLLTKNYFLYLIIKIVCQLISNILISNYANKQYPLLVEKNIKPLDKKIEKDIFQKVRALFFHKIGTFIVNGTDNIIISKFINVVTVGLYSNYYLIINAVNVLFSQIISSISASIGNLMVTEKKEKVFETFKRVRFLNFWIACFSGTCIAFIIQPFIVKWIGEEYLLKFTTVIVLVLNYYQNIMRSSYITFKDAAGIWYEDRYIPIIESILNIVFSIIFVKMIGLTGVFLGTIVSGLILWCYSYPKLVYKNIFKKSYFNYIKETVGYILIFIIILIITYLVTNIFRNLVIMQQLIINIIICLIIPNIVLILMFYKTDNFKYFKTLIIDIMRKVKKKEQENN